MNRACLKISIRNKNYSMRAPSDLLKSSNLRMKNSICAAIVGLIILSLTGCAPVKFYSNPGLTESTGLKYYTVKPFLLVEKDPVNGSITKATVLYLPDLVNP
jgi:hypothetical protein